MIKEYLDYCPKTGKFTWIKSSKYKKLVGKEAGTVDPDGYIRIIIFGKQYLAHRLAWWFVHDEFPNDELDHINRIRHDNSISNLRLSTRRQNTQNSSRFNGGATYRKDRGKWRSSIRIDNVAYSLGHFDTKEEAQKAYENKLAEINE